MSNIQIGIIGGSGLYKMEDLEIIEEKSIETPFGNTSAPIVIGKINNIQLAFLARHGTQHGYLPHEVPYKANIYALKKLGIKYIVSVSAVGSLKEEIPPRDLVIVDQYIDFTKKRDSTFFGNGILAHTSMAKPTCEKVNSILLKAAHKVLGNEKVHAKGTYIAMEGPQFSSFAESNFYRLLQADVIGMTNMPEAKLAMEAQIAYTALAFATDYDCWHPSEEAVTAEIAIANLMANAKNAQEIIKLAVEEIDKEKPFSNAHSALSSSLLTPLSALEGDKKELLELLLK